MNPLQLQQLESKHKSEMAAHFKSEDTELKQLKSMYEKELERLRSRHKTEMDQRVRRESGYNS